ncbi:MAG: hypothetical protein HC867_08840 [Bacteroidia bacterium]|nr:hypothetical protein [Bacteroidia bacterium]
MANAAEKEALETGGDSDYALGGHGLSFKPVVADKLLQHGDSIRLGETALVLLNHPGHTKGSCSYMLTVSDSARSYKVLIANMPTIVTDKKFTELTAYPTAAQDYAYSLKSLQQLQFDIWVASHASQFSMHDKHKPGDAYNPMAFADRKGFDAELKELQQAYDNKIKKDDGR